PAYVGRAKEVQKAEKAIEAGKCPLEVLEDLKPVMKTVQTKFPQAGEGNLGIGSTIFAVKPGDGSAREQAASCQKVLGGWANIANEYATKRYRSNLINWGMLPFLTKEDHTALPFENGDYIFVPISGWRRKSWHRKHDLCCETGGWIRQRTGSLLPESAGRLGKHCERVRHKALPFQPDQLGNAAVPHKRGSHGAAV